MAVPVTDAMLWKTGDSQELETVLEDDGSGSGSPRANTLMVGPQWEEESLKKLLRVDVSLDKKSPGLTEQQSRDAVSEVVPESTASPKGPWSDTLRETEADVFAVDEGSSRSPKFSPSFLGCPSPKARFYRKEEADQREHREAALHRLASYIQSKSKQEDASRAEGGAPSKGHGYYKQEEAPRAEEDPITGSKQEESPEAKQRSCLASSAPEHTPEPASSPSSLRKEYTPAQKERRAAAMERLAQAAEKHQIQMQENRAQQRKNRKKKLASMYKTLPCMEGLSEEGVLESIAAPAADLRDTTCIFFDWENTLFPAWHVEYAAKEGKPTIPESPREDAFCLDSEPLLLESMALHAAAVKELLQTARKFARVAIVTLVERHSVNSVGEMTKKYWHNFDFEDLLVELDIPVWYAREQLTKADRTSEAEGINLVVVAKRNAISKCLRKFKKKTGCMARNIISVGDSFMEQEAVKEVAWSMDEKCFCKSVLLNSEPRIANLTDELRGLTPFIGRMVAIQEDYDLNLTDVAS